MERRCLLRSIRKRGEERQGSGGARVLGERLPAWGRWEGAICETCGRCGDGESESGRGIPFVRDGEGPVLGRVA